MTGWQRIRITFLVLALVVFPLLGLMLSDYGTHIGSDVIAWLALLGLPAFLTILAGSYAKRSATEIAAVAVLSSGVAVGVVMILLLLAARSGGLS